MGGETAETAEEEISAAAGIDGGGDDAGGNGRRKEKLGLGEWFRGWVGIIGEFLFQRIVASHVENPLRLPPLEGFTVIVTGATSGIGLAIARQLAESGAHVVMAVRRPKFALELIQNWQIEKSDSGRAFNVEVMELDLLSLNSVAKFAEAYNALGMPLNALINNAGMFAIAEPQRFSQDGYEQHMQVNHLAPALLTMLLLPSLIRGSPSRIVNVNSVLHFVGFVDCDDMNLTSGKRKFTSLAGYSNSKLAQVMFTSILHRKIPAEAGISALCVNPGIVDTNVARDLPKVIVAAYHLIPYFIFDAQEGARSSLFAATDPQVPEYCATLKADEWPTCPYISYDCSPANPSEESHNLSTSKDVWEKTLEMIGLPSDALEKLITGEPVQCRYG